MPLGEGKNSSVTLLLKKYGDSAWLVTGNVHLRRNAGCDVRRGWRVYIDRRVIQRNSLLAGDVGSLHTTRKSLRHVHPEMWSDHLREHASNPRNPGPLDSATHRGVAGSPGGGPYMVLELRVEDGVIKQAAFQTYGCPSAIACGSMATLLITGRPVASALKLSAEDLRLALGGLPEGKEQSADLVVGALRNGLGG